MASPRNVKKLEVFVRLWHHECSRVFEDRLCTTDDHKTFLSILDEEIAGFSLTPE